MLLLLPVKQKACLPAAIIATARHGINMVSGFVPQGTTINVDSGPTLNPYQNHQHVGGSSGGTGAAIAARTVTAGFCSDTEGSCRIPASITGGSLHVSIMSSGLLQADLALD